MCGKLILEALLWLLKQRPGFLVFVSFFFVKLAKRGLPRAFASRAIRKYIRACTCMHTRATVIDVFPLYIVYTFVLSDEIPRPAYVSRHGHELDTTAVCTCDPTAPPRLCVVLIKNADDMTAVGCLLSAALQQRACAVIRFLLFSPGERPVTSDMRHALAVC